MPQILVLCEDLMLGSKIRETLKALGKDARFLSTVQSLAAAAEGAELVLADLSLRGPDPIPALAELKAGPLATARVIAFFSHVDEETRKRALEAGIDQVLPRSAFFANLPALVG